MYYKEHTVYTLHVSTVQCMVNLRFYVEVIYQYHLASWFLGIKGLIIKSVILFSFILTVKIIYYIVVIRSVIQDSYPHKHEESSD